MDLHPPPSPTLRAAVSGILTALSAIPFGIWVNALTANASPTTDIWVALEKTGDNHFFAAAGFGLLILNGALLYRWDILETRWRDVVDYTRARQTLQTQRQTLRSYCKFISEVVGVPVSGRAFEARDESASDGNLETRLYQVRDLFIENEPFPQETAYTYVRVTDEKFVASHAYLTRAPRFDLLPDDHHKNYGDREKHMVDPAQRWVLAAPILRFDFGGSPRDELAPRGVIVFYGKETPKIVAGSREWELARSLSRDAAEFFAYLPLSGFDREQVSSKRER